MKDVLKRMDGFELKGRKLELRAVSITPMIWLISYESYLWQILKWSFRETSCQRVEADLGQEVDQPHQRNDPDLVADLEVDLEALQQKDRSDPAAEAQNQKLVTTATRIEMILTRAGVNTFFSS